MEVNIQYTAVLVAQGTQQNYKAKDTNLISIYKKLKRRALLQPTGLPTKDETSATTSKLLKSSEFEGVSVFA